MVHRWAGVWRWLRGGAAAAQQGPQRGGIEVVLPEHLLARIVGLLVTDERCSARDVMALAVTCKRLRYDLSLACMPALHIMQNVPPGRQLLAVTWITRVCILQSRRA